MAIHIDKICTALGLNIRSVPHTDELVSVSAVDITQISEEELLCMRVHAESRFESIYCQMQANYKRQISVSYGKAVLTGWLEKGVSLDDQLRELEAQMQLALADMVALDMRCSYQRQEYEDHRNQFREEMKVAHIRQRNRGAQVLRQRAANRSQTIYEVVDHEIHVF